MGETTEVRLRRLTMRSMRRGIKEMDLLLSAFATNGLAHLTIAELDQYEALLAENDIDLLAWVTGATTPPADLAGLIARIAKSPVAAPR